MLFRTRQLALSAFFPELNLIEKAGRDEDLPIEDILDATSACWSALRLVSGKGRTTFIGSHESADGVGTGPPSERKPH